MLPISWFKYGEWVLYGLAILLGVANVVYMTEVFERTQFFLQRKWKVAWQLFHLAISSAIGLLLVGAAMSMRIPGAG